MNFSPKFKVIILVALFVLLFIFGAVGFALLSREYRIRQSLEQKIEAMSKEKEKVEQDLKTTQEEMTKLNALLKESKDKIQLLSAQIDTEKKTKDDLKSQVDALNLQLNTEKENKEQLQKQVSMLQGDLENFLTRFKELEEEKTNLQTKLDAYEGKVELGTVVVEPQGGTTKEGTEINKLSGSIVRVNNQHDFLVIDIGEDQGVKEGDIFSIYHTGEYIGDIEIEKVHPTLSAAKFLPNLKLNLLKESDTVVKKD